MRKIPAPPSPKIVRARDVDLSVEQRLKIRASANAWISQNFPTFRKYLAHSNPKYSASDEAWEAAIEIKNLNGHSEQVGLLLLNRDASIIDATEPDDICAQVDRLLKGNQLPLLRIESLVGPNFDFRFGDGIEGAGQLPDKSVDLVLTDPPYGISKEYTCERQVSRRLRKDGTDFIMPKGNFGEWDGPVSPRDWTQVVLPKVRGWFVTFCAQAQIGEYCQILEEHKFVAVGTLVWQKTNPVPFNHKYKPVNAWEALVVGKRPGTKFNGKMVHNVFLYKSPSPQQRIHSTQKPLPLMERLVELFSSEGDFVFDPFAGSATTVVAARSMGRQVLAYELDREIYDTAAHWLRVV